jgi:hypothetical protein
MLRRISISQPSHQQEAARDAGHDSKGQRISSGRELIQGT